MLFIFPKVECYIGFDQSRQSVKQIFDFIQLTEETDEWKHAACIFAPRRVDIDFLRNSFLNPIFYAFQHWSNPFPR